MAKMSPITVIEKYEEHKIAIQNLLASILSCFADEKMFDMDDSELTELVNSLCSYYPFVSLCYLLDAKGKQICMNVPGSGYKDLPKTGRGTDRSRRPYFILAKDSDSVVVTDPYLSSIKRELCLSTIQKIYGFDRCVKGYIVLDIDLVPTLSFLIGDYRRIHFEPYIKAVYSLIVTGLFAVVFILLYLSGTECVRFLMAFSEYRSYESIPFGVVIYLTLALAIFDLGKTILEEEVLLYKDIFRHSSTRRTITRFIAAIIIAVSIEALLMIFKAALKGGGDYILPAVWVVLAAAFLLLSLGVYVYLGSRAEVMLMKSRISSNLEPVRAVKRKSDIRPLMTELIGRKKS